jgi:peptide/nickel transport system substrate-binding protein
VQYNWQRVADPANKSPFAAPAQEIASMDVVEPLTLKVTLKAVDPIWDSLVARNLTTIGSPTALKASATAFASKRSGRDRSCCRTGRARRA